jgi:hypothetical protein
MRATWSGGVAAVLLSLLAAFYGWHSWKGTIQPQHLYHGRAYGSDEILPPKSADERIADYTEALAAFTLLLAVVSSIQIWFLTRRGDS